MRVKTSVASKRRKKRLLKQTKGFWGQRKNVYRRAKETLLRLSLIHISEPTRPY